MLEKSLKKAKFDEEPHTKKCDEFRSGGKCNLFLHIKNCNMFGTFWHLEKEDDSNDLSDEDLTGIEYTLLFELNSFNADFGKTYEGFSLPLTGKPRDDDEISCRFYRNVQKSETLSHTLQHAAEHIFLPKE
ncbi:hypothetical protein G9A89_010093 [Geosiphon pyriformis]|nr:hypothetical protein G9A89_010093 [Geosiphon pyriformis]